MSIFKPFDSAFMMHYFLYKDATNIILENSFIGLNNFRKMATNTLFYLQDNWDDDEEEKEAKVEAKKTGMFVLSLQRIKIKNKLVFFVQAVSFLC